MSRETKPNRAGEREGFEPGHPATVSHIGSCDLCARLVGLALAYIEPGRRLVAFKTPGNPRIDLRHASGLFWLVVGEELFAVTEDGEEARRLGHRLASEVLTPARGRVRLKRGLRGFRVVQGHEEIDAASRPSRLRRALEIAESWFPEEPWRR